MIEAIILRGEDGETIVVNRTLSAEEVAALQADQPRRALPKSIVWARLVDLGRAAPAKALLDQDAVAWGAGSPRIGRTSLPTIRAFWTSSAALA